MRDFTALRTQVIELLQREQRLSYRALQRQFALEDEDLEALKDELIYAKQLAVDEDGRVLVWTGGTSSVPTTAPPVPLPATPDVSPAQGEVASVAPRSPEAERRQLTVLFCDLVDSTVLAGQLDPEDWREVVRAYQETCAKVIARFEGHIAQYLGDGLLVYFGYPLAHEDDAQRAVRAGLGMVEALGQLNTRLTQERGVQLAMRLGVHTGLVVVGEVGSGTRQEQLALGETPNMAARLQGIAIPNTLVISATTFQLLGGVFACQPLGTSLLKGLVQPLAVYRVLYESMARSRLEAVGSTGWTPLVGREQEIGLLRERWAQVKEGVGQVVLLSGEAGIGKSRLVQVLTEHVAAEPQAWLTPCQCSPYYQNTALYPMIDLLERVVLRFDREESPEQKLHKLEGHLVQYGLPLAETVPLYASLLSIPLTADYAPLAMSPEQQKQQTLHTLLTTLLRIAAQQPVLFVMEDLHWVDPTTLEFLSLLVDQGPTARILALWTFRPDFHPPWTGRAHLTQVTLARLPRRQAAEMTGRVAHGKTLPPEVVEQIVARTDGVPLFVEEVTKMVLESGLLQEWEEGYALTGSLPPLAIPTTLHDALLARLDRLAAVKGLAQLGATLGREFSYELLHAVSPWDEETLQRGLHQLVAAEFLYQRGLPPQVTYVFKHALIQEAAYQSVLKRTRQQYHQRIAQVLEAQFPDIVEAQSELLAYHYTKAGLNAQAVHYWYQAGQKANARSAYAESISHLTTGLSLLTGLPDTSERLHDELSLQLALGAALTATHGWPATIVGTTYQRAWELCHQLDDTTQFFPVLWGLWHFHSVRAEMQTAYKLGEQLYRMGQRVQDPVVLLGAHCMLAAPLHNQGKFGPSRTHWEQGIALYDPQQHQALIGLTGVDLGVFSLSCAAHTFWHVGYADQALRHSHEAITRAQELSHPFTLALALDYTAMLHQFRGEPHAADACTTAAIRLCKEHGFAYYLAWGAFIQGWVLTVQGHTEEGIRQMRQGLDGMRTTGAELRQPYYLALLAAAYGIGAQVTAGFHALTEARTVVQRTGEYCMEAELGRLQGEFLLHRSRANEQQAGTCFQHALAVARQQQAKSLELRAAMSLARLWQQQGKRQEAHDLLAPVYGWFTEGFDTADLQEAKALLEALA